MEKFKRSHQTVVVLMGIHCRLPFEGVATEVWNIKVRLDSSTDNIDNEGGEGVQNADGSITRRFITWERENWAFDVSTGYGVSAGLQGRGTRCTNLRWSSLLTLFSK